MLGTMYKMTSHERFSRVFEHKEVDRMAMWDFPWPGAIKRWRREGMPENISYEDYFDVDRVSRIMVDNSPRYPKYIIEENDRFKTFMTSWGGKQRDLKDEDSTPDFVDYTIINREKWEEAKVRITPTPDRIPWDYLKANYGRWRAEGHWVIGDLWFSFNQLTSYVVGMERFLIYMIEEPELCMDMMGHTLDVNLQLLDMAWDAGYTFDMLNIRDDMGYKHTQFFSINMYREIVKPSHVKAVKWAHDKGIKTRLHSCGYIMPLLPEIVEVGFDALHPMEVKAGMNPEEVKKKYGNDLVLHGGLDATLWKNLDEIKAEIERLLPILKESGGYIFASDHSIPNDVSFENIKEIIALSKKLGSY
jgi:uroporphyrinogen decarboxylase